MDPEQDANDWASPGFFSKTPEEKKATELKATTTKIKTISCRKTKSLDSKLAIHCLKINRNLDK